MTYHGTDESVYRNVHIHILQIHVIQDLLRVAVQRLGFQDLVITVD